MALTPRDGRRDRPPLLADEVLLDPGGPQGRGLLPDPDGPGRARLLEPLLRDRIVALGPTVPIVQAAQSMAWAVSTVALARDGFVDDTGLVRSTDHVSALVISRSRALLEWAGAARLAAFDVLSPSQRDRIAETLLALLEHNFNATEAGAALHVHPQTVRYRLRTIEKLVGEDLYDPRARLEMQLILHAQLAGSRTDARPASEVRADSLPHLVVDDPALAAAGGQARRAVS
ncbi:helix-turn-helix domain-containing protein [Actinomadura yumaensis]|uniref:helix-turn-helix domain-containing protein n=1 Tax=Actinomadura yumaensis TaxID=111807 RepID=UPI003623EB72